MKNPILDYSKKYTYDLNSWFSSKKYNELDYKISKLKSTSDKVLRTTKIFIYPNKKQRNIIKTWFKVYQQVYNYTIKYFRKYPEYIGKSKITLRNIIKKSFDADIKNILKSSKIPVHTIDNAIFDTIKAYNTAFANMKEKNIKHFRLRCKKKCDCIILEESAFSGSCSSFQVRVLGNGIKSPHEFRNFKKYKKKRGDKNIIFIKHDVKLTRHYRNGSIIYTLHVPVDRKIKTSTTNKICALDPGLRTFQTLYDNKGNAMKIGTNNKRIKNLIKKLDVDETKFEDTKNRSTKDKIKRYRRRIYSKIKNLISDLHWKTCNYLCKNYDTIMVGNLSTQRCINKSNNLYKSCREPLKYMQHYLFRLRLQSKCEEYGKIYKEVDEKYTTQQCGKCMNLNKNVGSSKIYTCPVCKFTIDRDINGARNIFLKGVSI